MIEAIVVPDIGEGVVSGKVVAVHIRQGDTVAVEDTIVELETDKAVVEIPSTVSGRVVEVLAVEGKELKVGDVIVKVEILADAPEPEDEPATSPGAEETVESPAVEVTTTQAPDVEAAGKKTPMEQDLALRPVPASPSIRRMARELGVNIHEVKGSGPGGRISETDLKSHVKGRQTAAVSTQGAAAMVAGTPEFPDFTRWGEIETVELETVRRITAQSTATSWGAIPHVTQFDKADITNLVPFMEKNAHKVAKAGGKLTLTAILARVCAQALKRFPRFNASIDMKNERLIFKKYIHINVAVDTPRGLLMPVIQDADTKSITRLAVEIVDLAQRSRNKKIKPTELEGGTFSISNQGGIGGVNFTPIVLWPQVAILGISRSSMAPGFIDGQFQPRNVLPLSLSYDHRIIDGADAARFLRWICDSLEHPFTLHLFGDGPNY